MKRVLEGLEILGISASIGSLLSSFYTAVHVYGLPPLALKISVAALGGGAIAFVLPDIQRSIVSTITAVVISTLITLVVLSLPALSGITGDVALTNAFIFMMMTKVLYDLIFLIPFSMIGMIVAHFLWEKM